MVLLEGVWLLAQGHDHDDPASRFLNACLHYQKNLLHPKINSEALRHHCTGAPSHIRRCSWGREDLCVPDGRTSLRPAPLTPKETQRHCGSGEIPMRRPWSRITGTACMRTLSQARMLRGSSSVNNWKTEPLDGADKSRDHITWSAFLQCTQTQLGCPGTTAASLQGLLSSGYRLLSG